MANGSIVKWREAQMAGAVEGWLDGWCDELEENNVDTDNVVCFFFDDCDDYEFAAPLPDGRYWTAYGIYNKDGKTLTPVGAEAAHMSEEAADIRKQFAAWEARLDKMMQ